MENRDFKYIIQDITRIFLGKELTYRDLLEMEDIPFKLKAITNNYFLKDASREDRIIDHLNKMTNDEFSCQIYEQIKIKIKLNYVTGRKNWFGQEKDKYISKECNLKEYLEEYREAVSNGTAFVEEIIISKLALMALGC